MSDTVSHGAIAADAIAKALAAAQRDGVSFLQAFETHAALEAVDWLRALGSHFYYPTLNMEVLNSCVPRFDLLPLHQAMPHLCLLLERDGQELMGAIADPTDNELQAWAETRAGRSVCWHLAHPGDLRAYLARYEEQVQALKAFAGATPDATGSPGVEEISLQSLGDDANPVIRLVNSTIYDAMKAVASDIHLESQAGGMAIKYRIDGVLSLAGNAVGTTLAEQVVSRVKVLAELDIAERRVPQDGRFKMRVRGREIDFRVSIMPSTFGEDAVIRILDKEALVGQLKSLRLDNLGFDAEALAMMRQLSRRPHGMLLVTGPTGSGKTTTLYAALSEINDGQSKIVTIEDPVEYQLPEVLQIPVNEKKGLTFARGLRSILRHDPDQIMVGEIRDAETAEIAIQSALTGHLVFTTVHANNVFDVVGRFLHMGIDPYSLMSALNGIVAQRLVRLNCTACRQPVQPTAQVLVMSGLSPVQALDYRFMEGKGCGLCRGTGYRGRKAIAECMVLNDELRELILARTSIRELKAAAARCGVRSLREAALAAVRAGETTLQEINRGTLI